MPSHSDARQRFRNKTRKALEKCLGRPFDTEIGIPLPDRKPHTFDLATPERDMVAECRIPNWHSGTRTLREVVGLLKALPNAPAIFLILECVRHPKRGETFGTCFVRQNADNLGNIRVLEFQEESEELVCLFGKLEEAGATTTVDALTAEEIAAICNGLDRILDWVEELGSRNEGRTERVARLRMDGKLPKATAIHMLMILKAETVFSDKNQIRSEVVRSAWAAVNEWAKDQGCNERMRMQARREAQAR